MPQKPVIPNSESNAFVTKQAGTTTKLVKFHISNEQSPQMDKILEKTLIDNNINTGGLLTPRETEILRLIVSGRTNKQIARILSRTERTVEYHRNRLMRKMGVHNAADLVKRAITMGMPL